MSMSVRADDIGLEYAGALGARGVVFVKDTDDVAPGPVMMFSAYGVSPGVRAAAKERGLQVIDAACPLVTKVHNEVNRFIRRDYEILLVGHDGHEEVEGMCGDAPKPCTGDWRNRLSRRHCGVTSPRCRCRRPRSASMRPSPRSSVCCTDSPPCRIRPATTSVTPRRTAKPP